jgi:hypothetical protein
VGEGAGEDAIYAATLEFEVRERLAGQDDDLVRFPLVLESPLFAVLASGTPILVALKRDPRFGFSVADGAPPLLVDGGQLAAPDGVDPKGVDVATVADVRRHLKRFAAEAKRDAVRTPRAERKFAAPPTPSGELPPLSEAELLAFRQAVDGLRKWHAESRIREGGARNDEGPEHGTIRPAQ